MTIQPTLEFNIEVQQRKHWKRRNLSNRHQKVYAMLHLLVEFAK